MPYIRIGFKTLDVGYKIWEIIGRLPNRGVGRYITRSIDQRFHEPCFYKILSVTPNFDQIGEAADKIEVEHWHRLQFLGVKEVENNEARRNYFSLVPKCEEARLLKAAAEYKIPPVRVLPRTIALPPLLKMHLKQHHQLSLDRIPFHFSGSDLYSRQAKDGETPNIPDSEIDGIGNTFQKQLYEGIDLSQATYPPSLDALMPPPAGRIQNINTPPEPDQAQANSP